MNQERLELLAEANRRGILTGELKETFDEAVRRGLINRRGHEKPPKSPRAEAVKNATRHVPVLGTVAGFAADRIAEIPGHTDRKDLTGLDVNRDFPASPRLETIRKVAQMQPGPLAQLASVIPLSGQQARLRLAQASTVDDERMGQVFEKELGDRLLEKSSDKFGNSVLEIQDRDGGTSDRFVNEPGLDRQDVERSVAFALPFIATGTPFGAALRGAGLGLRSLGQFTAGSVASVGQDAAAQTLGAEQFGEETIPRALISGMGGAVGEQIVSRVGRFLLRKKGALDANGKLTDKARNFAKRAGLAEPEELEELSAILRTNRTVQEAENIAEGFRGQRAQQFGIQTTRGQRTQDPNLIAREEELFHGLNGADEAATAAAKSFRNFKNLEQPAQVQTAASEILPGTSSINAQTAADLGERIGTNLKRANDTLEAENAAAWTPVKNFTVSDRAILGDGIDEFTGLRGHLGREVGERINSLNKKTTPFSIAALKSLGNFAKGKAPPRFEALGRGAKRRSVQGIRSELSNLQRDAKTKTDRALMGKIVRGYESWLDDVQRLAVRPNAAGSTGITAVDLTALRAARKTTAQIKSLTTKRHKRDAAGRELEAIFGNPDMPSVSVIDRLIGNPETKLREHAPEMLRRVKQAAERGGVPEVWDDIRAAYWVKLVSSTKGNEDAYGRIGLKTPGMIAKSINRAKANQRDIMTTLYSAQEVRQMTRFAGVARDLTTNSRDATGALNPSGTSREVIRAFGQKVARTFFRGWAARERFGSMRSENVMQRQANASILNTLGDNFATKGVAKSMRVRGLNKKVLNQDVRRRVGPSSRGVGAAFSSSEESPGSRGLQDLRQRAPGLSTLGERLN